MAKSAVVGLDQIMKGLDSLTELVEPVSRAMGVAMGQTVRDEAIKRAPELKPGDEGYDNQRRGQLKEAIYLAYDGRRSVLNEGHFVYGVSWNARKAPHGHLVEFGHFMSYESARGEENGKWFTPIVGSHRVEGRKRGVGIPRVGGGFYVHNEPFLGPAFDAKLPTLAKTAIDAGQLAFSLHMK